MKLSRPSVGLAVRAARDAAGLTLKDLSEITGIPIHLISRTELGDRDLGYTEMLAIVDAVKVEETVLRELASAFEREGVGEKRQAIRDLNKLQRLACETLAAVVDTKAGIDFQSKQK